MRVISKKPLREFWKIHPKIQASMQRWFREAEAADWGNFAETRKTFPDADQVRVAGRRTATIFNVARTGCRIITAVDYRHRYVYVRFVLAHGDYEKGAWKRSL